MSESIATTGIHHLALTVSDLDRSEQFYTTMLDFKKMADLSPTRRIYTNGNIVMALTQPPDPAQAIPSDRFNENRLGLDHLSFSVASRDTLQRAARMFDASHISHGEIEDLGEGMGICTMAFRDPDNIQIELTSPR